MEELYETLVEAFVESVRESAERNHGTAEQKALITFESLVNSVVDDARERVWNQAIGAAAEKDYSCTVRSGQHDEAVKELQHGLASAVAHMLLFDIASKEFKEKALKDFEEKVQGEEK